MSDPKTAPYSESDRWTRIDVYLTGLRQQRRIRKSHKVAIRSEPESPNLALSTLPFAALLAVLAVLTVVFALLAVPSSPPKAKAAAAATAQQPGTAPKGWFQEAQKQFR